MLTLHHHDSARTFLARANGWLLEREIECATALQSARNASANDALYERPMYWATIEDERSIVGCCYRTPPYLVGVTALPQDALTTLVADLSVTYDNIPGFSGPEETATVLAQLWTAVRGGSWRIASRQRLLALPAEPPPRDTPGVLRLAGPKDAGLAQSWGAALSLDSPNTPFTAAFCGQLVAAKRLYFWVDDQPRCMIGVLRESEHFAAVGLMYTPATYRAQGYATTALTALQRLFAERRIEHAYLYVDPANDAAKALGKKLGGTLVHDEVDVELTAGGPG
ncbi:MAG: GNAT family N-acetyltransferase [Gammaproteobacteria bacterium]